MMQDWNQYHSTLMTGIQDYAAQQPEILKGLETIESAVASSGHLEPKVHELIALAVAVTTRCDGCIAVRTQKAIEHGATREEISEALGVAILMNAGPALVYSARVLEAHAQLASS